MALSKSKTDFEVEIAKAVGKKIKYCRENYYRPVKEIVDGEFKGTYKPVKMLITQSRLAKFLGVSFQQIQKFEKGANGVSLPKLLMIAVFFQKPITYFLEDINLKELLGQDTSPNNNPIAPSVKEYGINIKSKCH
tara:strand:+ start:2805 stop:3209 length:405 start_codon:yes stop_codon:yes gene_type:complete